MTSKFEVGKSYPTGSGKFVFECVGRTAKMATFRSRTWGDKRVKIHVMEAGPSWEAEETALPLGRYSMAPVVRAERSL